MDKITKAVVLAGGRGTRLSEKTKEIPKPLVKVGPYPIMLHIMRRLQSDGIKEFYILGGYLIDEIWAYLLKNIKTGTFPEPFSKDLLGLYLEDSLLPEAKVYLINTGKNTGTAERLKQVEEYLRGDRFIAVYGDSYSDVDYNKVAEKLTEKNILTLCGVPYREHFGLLTTDKDGNVLEFKEKSISENQFVNGGFICMKPEIFDYISREDTDFSKDVLEKDQLKGRIGAYIHRGYWKAVDTQRDLDQICKDYKESKDLFI